MSLILKHVEIKFLFRSRSVLFLFNNYNWIQAYFAFD